MNTYPAGNVVRCRFCFPSRALTDSELATFASAGTLPNGVTGATPDKVTGEYQASLEGPTTSVASGSITTSGSGFYFLVSVPVDTPIPAQWRYRGIGTNTDLTPYAATDWTYFEVA